MERTLSRTAVLDKAIALLDALTAGPLGVSELARATGIARPTVHRLCSSLEHHDLVRRLDDDRRELGARASIWAGAAPTIEQRLVGAAGPALRALRDATGESAQLYVVDDTFRRCVAIEESTQGLRTIVAVGERLPLNRGSAGVVLQGNLLDGWRQTVEERQKGVASVSAPVVLDGKLVAAISVSGPIGRTTRQPGEKYGAAVVRAAAALSKAL